jgi:hypothetical protein
LFFRDTTQRCIEKDEDIIYTVTAVKNIQNATNDKRGVYEYRSIAKSVVKKIVYNALKTKAEPVFF